jgi:sulfatase modifying factor 1
MWVVLRVIAPSRRSAATGTCHLATVGDFRLDKYEVTVGRFRAFVNAGEGTQASPPLPGAGVHKKIPGSGWSATWNAKLATDNAALIAALKCNPTYQTWMCLARMRTAR